MRALSKPSRPLAILTIIAATFAVYFPSLWNQFVWDDTALVLRDPFIRSWRLIPEGFRHYLFADATASNFYRPMQRLVFTFDYAAFGLAPWGYHFTSIALHAAAAVMLFLFVQRFIVRAVPALESKSNLLAWIVALAWAVHPVHTEAVCYIAGSADVLAAFFGFGALYCMVRALDGKSRLHGWLAALGFLAALLSKESGVTALVIGFALLLFLREFAAARKWLLVFAGIVVVYFGLRLSCGKPQMPDETVTPLSTRPILVARAAGVYSGLLAAPMNLHMERDILVFDHGDMHATVQEATVREYQTLGGFLIIAGFVAWLVWARKKLFAVFILLAAFLIAYAPTSDLFSLNATLAEHWLYFSSAFLFAAAALTLSTARVNHRLVAGIVACWIVFLGARTFVQNDYWKDQRTFLMSTGAAGGNSARVMINLGILESSEGRQKIAIGYFLQALNMRPDQPFALLGLANAYIRAGDFDNAKEQLQKARIIPFAHAMALERLAALEYQQNHTRDLGLLAKAAKMEPDNWEIQSTYIKTLADDGQVRLAEQTLRDLLETQWYRADSWKLMGDLLTVERRDDLAAAAYDEASRYDVRFKK